MNFETTARWACLGLTFLTLAAAVSLFVAENKTGGFALSGLFVISLIFVFLSRFKKFKGLGIEAELWEEAQFEAEILSKRLARLAEIVSQQSIDNALRTGRWNASFNWKELATLRADLVAVLDDSLNRNDVVRAIDQKLFDYLHFDFFQTNFEAFRTAFTNCHQRELKEIEGRFGSPITDGVGFGQAIEEWRKKGESITKLADPIVLAKDRRLGAEWQKTYREVMNLYGDCIREKIPDPSKIEVSISRILEIERLTEFDPVKIQDIFVAISSKNSG